MWSDRPCTPSICRYTNCTCIYIVNVPNIFGVNSSYECMCYPYNTCCLLIFSVVVFDLNTKFVPMRVERDEYLISFDLDFRYIYAIDQNKWSVFFWVYGHTCYHGSHTTTLADESWCVGCAWLRSCLTHVIGFLQYWTLADQLRISSQLDQVIRITWFKILDQNKQTQANAHAQNHWNAHTTTLKYKKIVTFFQNNMLKLVLHRFRNVPIQS